MNSINWKYFLIVAFLLFPLFFINVKDSHDWGDDFAQYLIQARNIVEDHPQTENGLLQNEKDPAYAIEAYPIGFPLLITPVYYYFKLDILPYCILNSFLLFFTGLMIFVYFQKRTNILAALLITLLFCYNLSTVDLKKQILSEIAFTCLLMFNLLWTETKLFRKKYSWIITGIVFAYLVSIRLAGIAFIAGYILFELVSIKKQKERTDQTNNFKKLVLNTASTLFFFLLLNEIIFPVKTGGLFNFYSNAIQGHELQLANNLMFYYTVAEYLFPFFGKGIPSIWILTALSGWLIRLIKSPSLCEYVFPIYLFLIIFYPYANAGLRFIIPVLPILIFYSAYFINQVFSRFGEKAKQLGTVVLIFPLIAYAGPILGIINGQKSLEDGPQQKTAIELFNYLKTTQEESAIVFCKARAMTLYSGRHTLYTAKKQNPEEANIQFHRYSPLYLVIAKVTPDNEIYDPKLLGFISIYKDQYTHVWENDLFNVFLQK